jgi:hypothetical protein
MPLVQIVALRDPAPFHLHDLYGSHDRVDRVVILEVLIEFAPAAVVVVGARFERNPPLQVMKAGSLGRG